MTIRPLTSWTGERTPASRRKAHNFTRQSGNGWDRQDLPWSDTLQLLDRELTALRASGVVVQISVTERDIRLDGQLRTNARPSDPAVRLLFDSKHGPLTYQCDRFATWQDNCRAIALGLEALRKVERYGITEHGEQYKGWLQLEAGLPMATPREVFAAVIGEGVDAADKSLADVDLWRRARAAAHPDRNGGRRELWDQVESAAKQLGLV
ncbi:molecular chaperone DnaJ [Propionicimonas paludicola]|nr:molecular chaperone DnaJ [Propionicimonas paludicola]